MLEYSNYKESEFMKRIFFVIFLSFFIVGCSIKEPTPKLETKKTTFDYMDGFFEDDLDLALEVFKKACKKSQRKAIFENVCINANYYKSGKEFFTQNFTPRVLVSNRGDLGLATGYYEPLLYGSRIKNDIYKYPIYKTPKDLVTIKDKDSYPEFKNYKFKAKIIDGNYVPYDTREQIEKRDDLNSIVYVDDKIDLFFLQIQGSGRVELENGEIINIGYANQNGRKYFAIGKHLLEENYISKENLSMQSIRKFLNENPEKMDEILNLNQSYIFFTESKNTATGSLNVPLVPKRNIAVDRRYIPLGMPVFVETINPKTKEPMNKLVVAADTGGAIKGEIRIDYFFGYGAEAEELAGLMKEKVRLFMLIPNI